MSHRKSHSHGSIPFSWEDKPGVCKTPINVYPINIGPPLSINKKPPSTFPPPPQPPSSILNISRKKIPLPPFQSSQLPPRSTSGKGFRWQEDPFLVAYKECTKNERGSNFLDKNKKGVGSNFSQRRSRSIFSCRGSCDVNDDSYLKLSHLPRVPAYRDRSLTLEDEKKRGFNYESWL